MYLAGCEAQGPRVAVPNRDEVALVDGEPLTLSAFLTIRDQLENPSKEKAFWVGVATLAIRKDLASRGKSLPDPAPFEIALYALGTAPAGEHQKSFFGDPVPAPDDARKRLDHLISRHVVQRNPQVLAGL